MKSNSLTNIKVLFQRVLLMGILKQEEIVARILSFRPELKKEDVQGMISRKKEGAGELLTEEGATYMVANELGVDLSDGRTLKTRIGINNIVAGASDVTITGKVLTISPVRTFSRNNGAQGKVVRIVVADETGRVSVVLWDEKTNIISQAKLSVNQDVRVLHGYTKEGLNGTPELNVGRRGTIIIMSSSDARRGTQTSVEPCKKICDLKEGDFPVNLIGVVRAVSPASIFERAGKKGAVMRLSLADETGRTNLVLWDEMVENMKEASKGDFLKLANGQVRKGIGGGLEVHAGRYSQVTICTEKPEGIEIPPIDLTKISELNPEMTDVDVLGRVVDIGQVREFTRSSGEVGRVGDLYLMDETGSIRLSLWDNKASALEDIAVGDTVLVEDAYAREGSFGIGINLGRMGSLTVNPDMKGARELPLSQSMTIGINQLKIGLGNVIVQGTISDEPTVRAVTTRDGQEVNVASFKMKDDTGEIKVSLWRDLVEKVRDLPLETRIQIKNVYVRTGFDGNPEISSKSTTEVEVLSKSDEGGSETIGLVGEEETRKMSDLKEGPKAQVKRKILQRKLHGASS